MASFHSTKAKLVSSIAAKTEMASSVPVMAEMSSFVPVTAESERMRSYVECPICLEVPRDGVMLQCVNGHNVCASCKNQLDTNKSKCPQGRCDYLDCPTRNRTVADIIESHPFEFKCKFAKSVSGCAFRGTEATLKDHEAKCEHRVIKCPKIGCDRSGPANRVVNHLAAAHELEAAPRKFSDTFAWYYMWRRELLGSLSETTCVWDDPPCELNAGWIVPCAMLKDGLMHFYVQMNAHSGVTDGLKCRITLGNADCSTSVLAPVFPIDAAPEEIMGSADCVSIGARFIQKMSETVTEEEKEEGFCSKLRATFKIVSKKTA